MRKPWQIWFVFTVTVSVVLCAMIWLSVKAVEVDRDRERDRRETEMARQEAELQERINSALYRIDLKLLPLVSREAARPYYLYQSFYELPQVTPVSNGLRQQSQPEPPTRLPSPLLTHTPRFVKLHFQVFDDGTIQSPRRPEGEDRSLALLCCGIEPEKDKESVRKVNQASQFCDFDDLVVACAPLQRPEAQQRLQQQAEPNLLSSKQIYNVPAIEKIRQQMVKKPSGGKQKLLADNKYDQQVSRGVDRGNREFNVRSETTQGLAAESWFANNSINPFAIGSLDEQGAAVLSGQEPIIRVGAMQPMWVNGQLLLARQVANSKQVWVQVCWLDWDAIESALKEDVSDLLPELALRPIEDGEMVSPGMALTTLPIELLVDSQRLLSFLAIEGQTVIPLEPRLSGLAVSLILAWIGLALVTFASAFLLQGVIGMSERRAAFVSAVTHELRTPLTTFRMYAEMLAEKMVPEGKTEEYAETLRVQADRLSHLVENVLQFARLERGGKGSVFQDVTLHELLSRIEDRLVDRTREAGLEFSLELSHEDEHIRLRTQPASVEQVLFNLVDNACKYGQPVLDDSGNRLPAVIRLHVQANPNCVEFKVCDNGPGISRNDQRRLFQPFCKSDQDAANSAPGVGLGLALCQRMARSLRGRLFVEDSKKQDPLGACFVLELPR